MGTLSIWFRDNLNPALEVFNKAQISVILLCEYLYLYPTKYRELDFGYISVTFEYSMTLNCF